jgi:hypothetical protein
MNINKKIIKIIVFYIVLLVGSMQNVGADEQTRDRLFYYKLEALYEKKSAADRMAWKLAELGNSPVSEVSVDYTSIVIVDKAEAKELEIFLRKESKLIEEQIAKTIAEHEAVNK